MLAVAMGILLATPGEAAEQGRALAAEPQQIDILRPDRLLLQVAGQPRGETTLDSRYMQGASQFEQARGYRNVSRSNLLNSPAARYLARTLTGTGKR